MFKARYDNSEYKPKRTSEVIKLIAPPKHKMCQALRSSVHIVSNSEKMEVGNIKAICGRNITVVQELACAYEEEVCPDCLYVASKLP